MKALEEIMSDTYSGLALYYRDTNLPEALIERYTADQIVLEKSNIAMSYRAGGLTKSLRFAIASNKATDQSIITPGAARWGTYSLPIDSHFKVLDIYTIDGQTQISLLHIPGEYLEAFQGVKTNVEEQLIGKIRKNFEEKVDADLVMVLEEEQWIAITEFPIGMNNDGTFIPVRNLDQPYRNELLGVNGDKESK